LLDFGLQLLKRFVHTIVTHGLVLGRIGLDLRTVQGEVPPFDQAGLLAQLQDMDKQGGQGLQVRLSEIRNGIVVRMLIRGEHAKGDLVVGGGLDLPRTGQAHAVGVENQTGHHPGGKRRLTGS
jgi:hypothetical protein